jgi:hypothetical protein
MAAALGDVSEDHRYPQCRAGFYFDEHGMQHRMDYNPEVNGDAPVAQYQSDPKTFGGIVVPTRRRIRRRFEDGTAEMTVDRITIDIHDVKHRAKSWPPSGFARA